MKSIIPLFVAVALLATLAAAPADATLLPPSYANQLIINFDLTSLSPLPPYDSIQFKLDYDPSSSTDSVVFVQYGDQNGSNFITLTNFPPVFYINGEIIFQTANPIFDPMLDGVFSIGLYDPTGSADLLSASAAGVIFFDSTTDYQTHNFPPSVPQPPTAVREPPTATC